MAPILHYFTEFVYDVVVKQLLLGLPSVLSKDLFFWGGGLPPNIETSHQEFSAMTAVKLKIMSIPVTHLLLNVSCLNFIIPFAALVAEYFRQRK